MSAADQSPIPSLLNENFGSVLFLGGTGTGKTFGLKIILKSLIEEKKHTLLYSINVKDLEYAQEFKKNHIPIRFEKIESIRPGSIVVIEDIIDLKTKEEIALRQLLNWHAHHKKLKIFCVSHNIFKTKLYNTLSFFKFIVFTSSLGNLFVLGKCLAYFQLEPEIVESIIEKVKFFKGAEGVYFFLHSGKRQFFATNNLTNQSASRILGNADSQNSQLSEKAEKEKLKLALQKRFEFFFKGQRNFQQAGAIFSIINQCVDSSHIDLIDLTLKFNSQQGPKHVSLIDYVNCLLTENQTVEKDQLVVHNFIQTKCNIPKIFLLNKHFEI